MAAVLLLYSILWKSLPTSIWITVLKYFFIFSRVLIIYQIFTSAFQQMFVFICIKSAVTFTAQQSIDKHVDLLNLSYYIFQKAFLLWMSEGLPLSFWSCLNLKNVYNIFFTRKHTHKVHLNNYLQLTISWGTVPWDQMCLITFITYEHFEKVFVQSIWNNLYRLFNCICSQKKLSLYRKYCI